MDPFAGMPGLIPVLDTFPLPASWSAPVIPVVPKLVPPPDHFTSNPEDWKEHTDKASGRKYYFNTVTKKSSWVKPLGFLTAQEKLQPVSSEVIDGTDWKVVFTRGGQSYYHNATTNQTTWTLPDSLNAPKLSAEDIEAELNANKRKADDDQEELDGAAAQKKSKMDYDPEQGTDEPDDALSNEQQRRFEALRKQLAAGSDSGSQEEDVESMDEEPPSATQRIAPNNPHPATQPQQQTRPQFIPQQHPQSHMQYATMVPNPNGVPILPRGGAFGLVNPPPLNANSNAHPLLPPLNNTPVNPAHFNLSKPTLPGVQQQIQQQLQSQLAVPEAEVHSESDEDSNVRKIDESEYLAMLPRQSILLAQHDQMQDQQQRLQQRQAEIEQQRVALLRQQAQQQAMQQQQQVQQAFQPQYGHLGGEERVNLFKELLNDKVPQFPPSDYDQNLAALSQDVRFYALQSDFERRNIFDGWMRSRTNENNKKNALLDKKQQRQKAEDEFKEMLDQLGAKLTHKTTYEQLLEMCKEDERFNAVDNKSDRLLLLNEKLLPLRQEFSQKKGIAEDEFKQLLRESITDFIKTRWNQLKSDEKVASDRRFHGDLLTPKEREALFDQMMKVLKKESENRGKNRESKEVLKDREREVRAQREKEERLMERERERMVREEEVAAFSALLAEHMQNSKITWTDLKERIQNDPRFKATHLTGGDKERLYNERLNSLQGHHERELLAVLKDLPWVDFFSKWDDIRSELPKEHISDRKKENESRQVFDNFVSQKRAEAEAGFFEMLNGFDKIKKDVQVNSKEYDTIKVLLCPDARWQRLDSVPELRETLLQQHIQALAEGVGEHLKKKPSGSTWVVELGPAKRDNERRGDERRRDDRRERRDDRDRDYDSRDRRDDRRHDDDYERDRERDRDRSRSDRERRDDREREERRDDRDRRDRDRDRDRRDRKYDY